MYQNFNKNAIYLFVHCLELFEYYMIKLLVFITFSKNIRNRNKSDENESQSSTDRYLTF